MCIHVIIEREKLFSPTLVFLACNPFFQLEEFFQSKDKNIICFCLKSSMHSTLFMIKFKLVGLATQIVFYVLPDYISSLNITLNIQNIRAYIFLFPKFTMLFRRIWIYLMKEVMFKMTLKGELDIDKWSKRQVQAFWR